MISGFKTGLLDQHGSGEIGTLEAVVLNRHRCSYRASSDTLENVGTLPAPLCVGMQGLIA